MENASGSMAFPHKPALTDVPILYAIKERWSPRAFSSKPIPSEKILAFFEAARWAPSSFNEQPFFYIYATKDPTMREERATLESLLAKGNAWAKNAYMLLLSIAKDTFSKDDSENRHASHDTGAATAYLQLQLQALGLIGHQMAGFDHERARKVLGIPAVYTPVAMMAVGYPGDRRKLTDKLKEYEARPRERKPIEQFVFAGRWGKRANF
jgi:nitroreductase